MRHACPCPRNPRYFWSFIFPVCAGRRSSVFGVLRVSIPPDLQAALGTHVRRQLCDARVARDEHPLCARKARHLCTQCAGKPHLNTAYETCLQDKRHLLHDAEGAARAEQGGRDKERERVCVRVRTEIRVCSKHTCNRSNAGAVAHAGHAPPPHNHLADGCRPFSHVAYHVQGACGGQGAYHTSHAMMQPRRGGACRSPKS